MSLVRNLPIVAFSLLTAFSVQASNLKMAKVSSVLPAIRPQPQVVAAPAPTSQFKSYREWKTDQIQDAQGKVTQLKTQIDQRKQSRTVAQGTDPNLAIRKGTEAQSGADAAVERLEKQLQQEQYDLEIAKDLSVTDYFVGYLTKVQDKKSAINEVAGKLSPEEVAELMTAYANSVFGSQSSDLPVSASNVPKDQVK